MAPLTQRQPRSAEPLRWAVRLGVFALLAALLSGVGAARGQTPGNNIPTSYVNQTKLKIPFNDPNDSHVRKVHLDVSEDRGKSYDRVQSAGPGDKFFLYTAQHDGLYYLTTQTEDTEGRLYPPDARQFPPMLMVIVDTKKPVITLNQAQAREGYVAVGWDIRDDNLDASSLRVDYRVVGTQSWIPLPVDRRAFGSYEWSAGGSQYEVHFQVSDLAGNSAEQSITVSAGGKPGPASTSNGGASTPTPDGAIWVPKRDFHLNYNLEEAGPSGVSKIEIWQCSPSLEWQKLDAREMDKAKSPLPIRAPGEGRYGFTLIPISGVDLAMPRPVRGDAPQIWVEVDETPPTVRILRVEAGRGADSGDVTIYWDATDNKQLAANPISIYYSDKPNGEWKQIATQLPNTRTYTWGKQEHKPYQCYIKVEAADMAGNVGRDIAKEAVKVDLTIPRLKITGVKPAITVTPMPPSGSPP